jgi:hypothetical protein
VPWRLVGVLLKFEGDVRVRVSPTHLQFGAFTFNSPSNNGERQVGRGGAVTTFVSKPGARGGLHVPGGSREFSVTYEPAPIFDRLGNAINWFY